MNFKVRLFLSTGLGLLILAGLLCARAHTQPCVAYHCKNLTTMSGFTNGTIACFLFPNLTGRLVKVAVGGGGTVCPQNGQQTVRWHYGGCDGCTPRTDTKAHEGSGIGFPRFQWLFPNYGCRSTPKAPCT
jgi:hypothetical protein